MAESPTEIITLVESTIGDFVEVSYQNMMASLAPALTTLFILLTVFIGISVLYSRIGMPAKTAIMLFLKAVIVYTLFTQWGEYNYYFHEFFHDAPNEIIGYIVSARNETTDEIGSSLDGVFDQGFEVAKKIREQGGLMSDGPLLYSFTIIFSTVLMIGLATFLLVLSKLGLAILLIIGPIFIAMILFESTRGLFKSWLSYVITYALIPILIYAMLTIILTVLNQSIIYTAEKITMKEIAPFLLINLVSFLLFTQVVRIAEGIGSGILKVSQKLPEIMVNVSKITQH